MLFLASACLAALVGCSTSAAMVPDTSGQPSTLATVTAAPDVTLPGVGIDAARLGGTSGSAAASGLLSSADVADFRERFGESAGVAVVALNGAQPQVLGDARTPYAWSTSKLLVVVALVRDVGGANNLTEEQRELVTAALGASDNESAALLMAELEARHEDLSGALAVLTGVLRAAGDDHTTASATDDYSTGETVWALSEQARFLGAVTRGCLLDPDSTRYLLAEMGGVIEEQRWGLGEVGSRAFKGGWDVDDEDLLYVRQVGLLQAGDGHDYVVALSARTPIPEAELPTTADPAAEFAGEWREGQGEWPSLEGFDYTFTSSEELAGAVGRWVRQRVDTAPEPAPC